MEGIGQPAVVAAPRIAEARAPGARIPRGEPLLLSWYQHTDGEFVRAVTRVETSGDRLARVQNYFFTPEFLADVCGELDVPFHTNGHRNW